MRHAGALCRWSAWFHITVLLANLANACFVWNPGHTTTCKRNSYLHACLNKCNTPMWNMCKSLSWICMCSLLFLATVFILFDDTALLANSAILKCLSTLAHCKEFHDGCHAVYGEWMMDLKRTLRHHTSNQAACILMLRFWRSNVRSVSHHSDA